MKIEILLSDRDICSLDPGQTVLEATRSMVDGHCGSVAVVEGGELVGIFTERDLMVRVVAKGKSAKTTRLVDVMTTELYTTTPDRTAREVRREMRERHIRHVPVLKDGKLCAVLSSRDLLRADFEEERDSRKALTDYIRDPR